MSPYRIGVIPSTTRKVRFADKPADWIADRIAAMPGFVPEWVDLREYDMPLFQEDAPPSMVAPTHDAVTRWSKAIDRLDGMVFVTAEYNHGIPAVLKNALDYAASEFRRKPAAFIGYGGVGGARAVEQLRLICVELQIAPLRPAVHIGLEPYLAIADGRKSCADFDFLETSATAMIEDLGWWVRALHAARQDRGDNDDN